MHPLHSEHSGADGVHEFRSLIVLDRTATLVQIQREARNRVLVFALGTLLLLATAVVWQFTVRVAQMEGKTRVLQSEARHLRELSQAAAGLAHETRNPLGLIRGWTQRLAEAGLPGAAGQEQACAVLEECDRVTARINQFLAFARQPEPILEPVLVGELVADLQSMLQPDLDERALRLEALGMDGGPAIMADREQLRQILFNLLQNAIAYAPANSAIGVTMRRSQPTGARKVCYRLEVTDHGPGVSPGVRDTLFEPYVSERPGGTGLGLSIARRIAVAHAWEIGQRQADTGGSIFWIDGIVAADRSASETARTS
jgi:signal transduction histidine kinase